MLMTVLFWIAVYMLVGAIIGLSVLFQKAVLFKLMNGDVYERLGFIIAALLIGVPVMVYGVLAGLFKRLFGRKEN